MTALASHEPITGFRFSGAATRERPHVAMIIQNYHPFMGGAEIQLGQVSRRLADRGYTVSILTRRLDDSPTFSKDDGVAVHRIDVSGSKPVASLRFTAGALRLLARLRPDVVHAHELLSPTTTALAYKALSRVPVVAKVLRGGGLGDVEKLSASRNGRLRLAWIRQGVDGFAVISGEIDGELARNGVPLERRHRIPNGVDVDRYRPYEGDRSALRRKLGLPDGPVALFAGRLRPEKRPDALVGLWPAVRAAVPGATLVIAGEGPLADALAARRPEGVMLVGRCHDMVPWLQAADVFALPSSTEGLSNALLEAMACGLAPVATPVGGAVDLLADGTCGWLAHMDAGRRFQSALILGLSGRAEAASKRGAARRRIVERYSLTGTVDRLDALYGSLIRAAHGAPAHAALE